MCSCIVSALMITGGLSVDGQWNLRHDVYQATPTASLSLMISLQSLSQDEIKVVVEQVNERVRLQNLCESYLYCICIPSLCDIPASRI